MSAYLPTMPVFLATLASFGFYWLMLFVACFAVVEFGQNYLYDEPTPSAGLKVTAGSLLLALLLTWTRTEFLTMFTDDLFKTILLGVAAFVIFTLILRFQPWHALPIGLLTVFIFAGMATMGVQSFSNRNRPLPSASRPQSKPIRRSTPASPPQKSSEPVPPAKKS